MGVLLKSLFYIAFLTILAALSCLFLYGCTGGSGGDSWRYDPGIPSQVTGFKAVSGNKLVTLSWDGNPLATSYNIYYVSALNENSVTKSNGAKINVSKTTTVISGLNNNITYYFMVTALNRDGESIGSVQLACTPRPISNEDLPGTWYFHTLITSPDAMEAGWKRGTMTVTMDSGGKCAAVITDFEVSNPNGGVDRPQLPAGFDLSVNGDGELTQTGTGAWLNFHGTMGSRKNMMIASYSPGGQSQAIVIFQKKRGSSDYSVNDMRGTGSGQNPNDPTLQGNGPTRFAYHQLYSGSNSEWEYSNGKMGKDANFKYWDFSTPTFKVVNFYFLFNSTSVSIDSDGLVTEYWNFDNIVNPSNNIYSYNNLVPKQPHQSLFTGRMTDDKTVIVGVSTRTDAYGNNPQYFIRILQLCFIPTDQALPQPTAANDLIGSYKFHKLGFNPSEPAAATSAYGVMEIASTGATTVIESANSTDIPQLSNFVLYYYPDPNPDKGSYRDFANFTTLADSVTFPGKKGNSHYHNTDGTLKHNYFEFYNKKNSTDIGASYIDINDPSTWRPMTDDNAVYPILGISPYYYNEHGSLSLNGDMLVMTRTDSSGYSILIGLK